MRPVGASDPQPIRKEELLYPPIRSVGVMDPQPIRKQKILYPPMRSVWVRDPQPIRIEKWDPLRIGRTEGKIFIKK